MMQAASPPLSISMFSMMLEKCEFGKTGYSLNIVHPPVYEEDDEWGSSNKS